MATQRTPTGLLVAQTIGLTASAYLLGQNASLSFISIPVVMQAPAPLAARQWRHLFNIGAAFGLPLAITSGLSFAYIASQYDTGSTTFKLNLAASILLPGIIPFTIAVMKPTNDKLFERVDSLSSASLEDKTIEAKLAQSETTHALLDKWATLNLARAVLIAAGTLCGVIAAVDKVEVVGFGSIGLASGANRL